MIRPCLRLALPALLALARPAHASVLARMGLAATAGDGVSAAIMRLPEGLPPVPGLPGAVAAFLSAKAPPDVRTFAAELDRLPAASAAVPVSVLAHAAPAETFRVAAAALAGDPEAAAARLAQLDLVLWRSPVGRHVPSVQDALATARASTPFWRRRRLDALIAGTLRELSMPPADAGAGPVVSYQDAAGSPSRVLTPSGFQEAFGVEFVPGLVVPDEARAVVRGRKSYARLAPTDRALADAYAAQARAGRGAATLIAPVSPVAGLGLFAAQDIPRGALIGEYAGRLSRAGGLYAIDYVHDGEFSVNVDAQKVGNHLRFMNHSDQPNAKVQNAYEGGLWRVLFIAQDHIRAGEQILFDYGAGYWAGMKMLGRPGPERLTP